MTLNGVMAVILRYFSEFAYLPGVLRKSSRSLSYLLMSSCCILALCIIIQNFTVCRCVWKYNDFFDFRVAVVAMLDFT